MEDINTPNKAAEFNAVFNKTNESPRVTQDYYAPTANKERPFVEVGATVMLAELDPETTDKVKSEKFFADTRQLDECIAQAENLQDMLHSEMMALKVVGILSFGLRKSGELLSDAIYKQKMAKTELKRAQAMAALEHFNSYLKALKENGTDLKPTDGTRGHYINIDQGVLKAAEKEALCEAIVSQLDTYKTQFTMAMSAVKAMIGKQRGDSMISGSATPTLDEIPF